AKPVWPPIPAVPSASLTRIVVSRAQSPACVPAYITKDMSAAALYDVGCLPPYMPRRNVTLSAKISRQAVLTQAGCFHNDQRRLDVGNRPQPEEEDTESSCATHIP